MFSITRRSGSHVHQWLTDNLLISLGPWLSLQKKIVDGFIEHPADDYVKCLKSYSAILQQINCFQVSEDFTARARKYWKEAGVENKVNLYVLSDCATSWLVLSYLALVRSWEQGRNNCIFEGWLLVGCILGIEGKAHFIPSRTVWSQFCFVWLFNWCHIMFFCKNTGRLENCSSNWDSSKAGRQQWGRHLWLCLHRCWQGNFYDDYYHHDDWWWNP